MSAMLAISRIHHPITTLGPGRRVGLWVQGCALGCTGCLARDTWDSDAGRTAPVADVASLLADIFLADPTLTGLTISGGEPTQQSSALQTLLVELRSLLAEREPAIDVLLYSGLAQRRLFGDHPDLVAEVDAIIPEPYVAAKAPGGRWRGSSNQPLILMTDLARARYAGIDLDAPAGLQMVVSEGELWIAGVPQPGVLDELASQAAAHGVTMGRASWRT